MELKANTYSREMCLSGNHTEIAQMAKHFSSNGKILGSIPGSVMPRLWQTSSALKTGRWEVLGLIPDRAC